jgi:hypothetical protein
VPDSRKPPPLVLPARAAALAWLNCFLATSQDDERGVLYRTISIEFYRGGLQFVCCDGTALFRSWVPVESETEWPLTSEKPITSIIAMDPDGFGIGFMRTLLRVTSEEGHEFEQLHITTKDADDSGAPALGRPFLTTRVVLLACGQRLDLRLMDATYPNWRGLQLGVDMSERVDGMKLAPRILGQLGKLKDVTAVSLDFHGEERRVDFIARGGTEVRGMIMPMRRFVEKKKPVEQEEDEQEPVGAGARAQSAWGMDKAPDA